MAYKCSFCSKKHTGTCATYQQFRRDYGGAHAQRVANGKASVPKGYSARVSKTGQRRRSFWSWLGG